MELMLQDDALTDFDVFTFGYATGVWRAPRIETIVQQFRNAIAGPLKDYQIVLCGHSMGGLVCMQHIITELANARTLSVVGLNLYGTPIEGSALVNVTKLILGFGALKFFLLGIISKFLFRDGSQLTNLAIASEFLSALRGKWARHVLNGGHDELPNNQRTTISVRVVSGNEDFVVSESSAKSYFGDLDWYPVQYGHIDMVKPSGHQHEAYQALQSYLVGCRYSDTPAIRTRLKQLSERVWAQRNKKLITNWNYHLDCFGPTHNAVTPWNETLRKAGFGVTRVTKCQYRTLISKKPYTMTFAYGAMEIEQSFHGNPAYVHFVRTDALAANLRENLSRAIDQVLEQKNLEDVWNALFRNAQIRVAASEGSEWIDLKPSAPVLTGRAISREYCLPSLDSPLLDREGLIAISFDSVRPGELTDISVEFPWLTYCFEGAVTIHGATDFVSTTEHGLQEETFRTKKDEPGNRTTVTFSIEDVVLPGSSIRVRWLEKDKEEVRQ